MFEGAGKCASCHVPPLFTEPGFNMHTAAEIGIDDFQASRSPDHGYRTAPLRGLFSHTKGGFYHDGRFATLGAVVDHYDTFGTLGLTAAQKADLVEYSNRSDDDLLQRPMSDPKSGTTTSAPWRHSSAARPRRSTPTT